MFIEKTYTAPSAWAPYLINGDPSGLDGPEIAQAEMWLADINLGWPVGANEAGFCWHHDAFEQCPFGADCLAYSFLVEQKEVAA